MMGRWRVGLAVSMLSLSFVGSVRATLGEGGPTWTIAVNSNGDEVRADEALTLREAIAIVNGNLRVEELSPAERSQLRQLPEIEGSRIEFALDPQATTIALTASLPPLQAPVAIDGTTQPGFDPEEGRPRAVVTLTPAPETEILRGLVVMAPDVSIRGLSVYGFTATHQRTASPPAADILILGGESAAIVDRVTLEEGQWRREVTDAVEDVPIPNNVTIAENWLGLLPDGTFPERRSAFGVWVFEGTNVTVEDNAIAAHDGSAVITSVRADNLQVNNNQIFENGFRGMPDALRLEGYIDNTAVFDNEIYNNAGAGIFLFNPSGAVAIADNIVRSNGRRLQRAAIYLMGSGHQVRNNEITDQPGPGVVVAADPPGDRIAIEDNRFANLAGLSIDLNTTSNDRVKHFQIGDGPNPPRNSGNRRKDTGNRAIEAPQFLAREFYQLGDALTVDGLAEPGGTVEIYRVNESGMAHGPLSEPVATVATDGSGRFSIEIDSLEPGTTISAIVTHPDYGTSEPARNATVRSRSDAE
jgi:parallel beta-helix repeat protein